MGASGETGSCSNTSMPAPPELACAKGGSHGVVVDDRATRGVHHDGVVFHELDVVGVQQMMGCRHERRVEADHVGGLQQLLEGRVGEVLRREAPRDSLVIPHHDVEPEPARFPGHRTARCCRSPPHRRCARAPGLRDGGDGSPRCRRAWSASDLVDAPQTRECKRDGVIAHHFRAVAGHVAHGASVGRGRRDIDVVHAGAGFADHLQLGKRRKHLGGEAP